MKEKEKIVRFASDCNGGLECQIHGATMPELIASITLFINHCYTNVFTDDIQKKLFKETFNMAYNKGLLWITHEEEKDSSIELNDLKILADLLKRLSGK